MLESVSVSSASDFLLRIFAVGVVSDEGFIISSSVYSVRFIENAGVERGMSDISVESGRKKERRGAGWAFSTVVGNCMLLHRRNNPLSVCWVLVGR